MDQRESEQKSNFSDGKESENKMIKREDELVLIDLTGSYRSHVVDGQILI